MRLIIVGLLLTGCYALQAQSFPPAKPLTDEVQIRLVLQKIEQGIKEQNVMKVSDGFANEVESNAKLLNRKTLANQFKTTFNNFQSRGNDSLFIKRKPPRTSLTTTWDFEMDIDDIKFF